MSNVVIRVENISKQYKIGAAKYRHDTLRDQITYGLRTLFSRDGHRSSVSGLKDTIWALKDVSFEVKQGEIVGIIGRNGAGKSTLLKIFSRITEPTTGFVEMHGRVAALLEVGTGFNGELTGRENIYLNGAILGMKKAEIERKFDEIVAFSELEKFIDTPVKRYSSGMYLRLAFAVAAHLENEILLADEVLAVGDLAFQEKCLGKMHDAARDGRTVLFISHNMQAVNTLCNRVVLLQEGSIADVGPTQIVLSKYVRALMGKDSTIEEFWPDKTTAPGNDNIRLRRVRLVSDTGDKLDAIQTDRPVRVEIEYWNLVQDVPLVVGLGLYTAEHFPVLESMTADDPGWERNSFPAGLFRSQCHIPADFLNEGDYIIGIWFAENGARVLYGDRRALYFTVHDTRVRKIPWFGRFQGIVRPMFDWRTKSITADTETDS
jgi:lipopolysaccharide transport system ATP-binding protein